jgi:hypothetical protein
MVSERQDLNCPLTNEERAITGLIFIPWLCVWLAFRPIYLLGICIANLMDYVDEKLSKGSKQG